MSSERSPLLQGAPPAPAPSADFLLARIRALQDEACAAVKAPLTKTAGGSLLIEPPHGLVEDLFNSSGPASVYVALHAAGDFDREAEEREDQSISDISESRARYCEVVATLLLRRFSKDERNLVVLTRAFQHLPNGAAETALERAVQQNSYIFIQDPRVQNCVHDMWLGHVVVKKDKSGAEYGSGPRAGVSPANAVHNLRLPRYQYWTENCVYVVLLALFTTTTLRRSYDVTAPEVGMLVIALAYLIDEAGEALAQGRKLYLLLLTNWFDAAIVGVFLAGFVVRCVGLAAARPDVAEAGAAPALAPDSTRSPLNRPARPAAYDLWSLNAVLLWMRLLTILAGFRSYGVLLIVFQRMLAEAVAFLVILAVVAAGFTQARSAPARRPAGARGGGAGQSFAALWGRGGEAGAHAHARRTGDVALAMVKGLMGDPAYDDAISFHPTLGVGLYTVFLTLGDVLLLNLLVAIFSDTYSRIVENARAEFLLSRTNRVLAFSAASASPGWAPIAWLEGRLRAAKEAARGREKRRGADREAREAEAASFLPGVQQVAPAEPGPGPPRPGRRRRGGPAPRGEDRPPPRRPRQAAPPRPGPVRGPSPTPTPASGPSPPPPAAAPEKGQRRRKEGRASPPGAPEPGALTSAP
eukprot:tig00021493_g21868.t1